MADILKLLKKAIDFPALSHIYALEIDSHLRADYKQTFTPWHKMAGPKKCLHFGKARPFYAPTAHLFEPGAIKKVFATWEKPGADQGFRTIRRKLVSQTIPKKFGEESDSRVSF